MLTPSIAQFRRRRGQGKAPNDAPTPPPVGITITEVTHAAAGESVLRISFSAAVAWNGSDVPAAFRAFTEDGFMDPCVGVDAAGADWIEVEFNANVALGAAWELVGSMAGITPAVTWPQNGTVS